MKLLVLDNYDSFTFNLVHLLKKFPGMEITVARNNEIELSAVNDFEKIVLSPGPGIPNEAGILLELIRTYAPTKSILGVCLGHQAIAETFGGKLINMKNVCHGQGVDTDVIDPQHRLFRNISSPFKSGRYHSWMVDAETLPECLHITATDGEKRPMALRHKSFDVHGIQFHPESILTDCGHAIIENWLQK